MLGMAAVLANDSGGWKTRCSCITDSMADMACLLFDLGLLAFGWKVRPAAYLNLTEHHARWRRGAAMQQIRSEGAGAQTGHKCSRLY
ncbi:hypothetical protein D3C85_1350060 [compost metagenome]